MNEKLNNIVSTLINIKEDDSIPKDVREKISLTISSLTCDIETSLKINKAVQELDDASNHVNIPSYTRIEILNVISILGSIEDK
jgi:uncharacterized protein (UPF0147 family)